jgi:hypothetical protein
MNLDPKIVEASLPTSLFSYLVPLGVALIYTGVNALLGHVRPTWRNGIRSIAVGVLLLLLAYPLQGLGFVSESLVAFLAGVGCISAGMLALPAGVNPPPLPMTGEHLPEPPPVPFPLEALVAGLIWTSSGIVLSLYLGFTVLANAIRPFPNLFLASLATCLSGFLVIVGIAIHCGGIITLRGFARTTWQAGVGSFILGSFPVYLAIYLRYVDLAWESVVTAFIGVLWMIAGLAAVQANDSYRTWKKENLGRTSQGTGKGNQT